MKSIETPLLLITAFILILFISSVSAETVSKGTLCGYVNNTGKGFLCNNYNPKTGCPVGFTKVSISSFGGKYMHYHCKSNSISSTAPLGTMCGLANYNNYNGWSSPILCNGYYPNTSCPYGYISSSVQFTYSSTSDRQYSCIKNTAGAPIVSGMLCGRAIYNIQNGWSTSILCKGYDPRTTCPPGYYRKSIIHHGGVDTNYFCVFNINTCSNECISSGVKQCSGDYSQTCGNFDNDACLEWGKNNYCRYGCANVDCNSCIPATCESLKKKCGSWSDGCGKEIECNIPCSFNQRCNSSTGLCILNEYPDYSSNIIITEHRYDPVAMFGGWGQHLGHLVKTSDDELWFIDDTENNVSINPAIVYYKFENNEWVYIKESPTIGNVQQNLGSISVDNMIYSYGNDINNSKLEECSFDSKTYLGECKYLDFTINRSTNYIGAAVTKLGKKIVWWTQVIPGAGKFNYVYNLGNGWKMITGNVPGYNDAGYVTIDFEDESNFVMNAELLTGTPPKWNYFSAFGNGVLGNPINKWTIAPAFNGINAASPNDIWINPINKDIHAFSYTSSGTTYYYKKKNDSSYKPLYFFPHAYRLRVIDANNYLYVFYGDYDTGLKIIKIPKNDITNEIIFDNYETMIINLPPEYKSIVGIYPEKQCFQTANVTEVNLALVSNEKQNEVLHINVD